MHNTDSIKDVKKDFIETLEKCTEINLEICKNVTKPCSFLRTILKLFAPFL